MLNTFQVNAIQTALIQAGLHYFDATGVWDNNTTMSYRQYHAVVLLKPDHTLEQPHHILSVCAELLELAGLNEANNWGSDAESEGESDLPPDAPDDDEDSEENDGEDDSDLTDEQIAALNGEGKALVIDGSDLSPEDLDQVKRDFLALSPAGSAVISTGEQAVVVDGTINPLQEGFQLDQADLDQINGQSTDQQADAVTEEATEQAEHNEASESVEQEDVDVSEQANDDTDTSDVTEPADQQEEATKEEATKEEATKEEAAPAEQAPAPKLTKAQQKAAAKLAAEQEAAAKSAE